MDRGAQGATIHEVAKNRTWLSNEHFNTFTGSLSLIALNSLLTFLMLCACLVALSCLILCKPLDITLQAPLPMGFFRQEYWSRFLFPSPGDLPDLGIIPKSPVSPALQADSLPTELLGKPIQCYTRFPLGW